jgi:hypothetical protein
MSQYFERFEARLAENTDNPEMTDVISMQMVMRIVAEDGSGLVGTRVTTVTFEELATVMADDVLAAVKAAVDAEVAARG